MRVRWEVSDGYAGPGRPQYTEVPDEVLAECESDGERDDVISAWVQGDFENNITWGLSKEIDWDRWRAEQQRMKSEEDE